MNPIDIAFSHIPKNLWQTFFVHSVLVTRYSLQIAERLSLKENEKKFIEEAAMLHDIGIGKVSMNKTESHGKPPYIQHGLIGQKILDDLGYHQHGLVCRNHIGVGLTKEVIISANLDLPAKDMIPTTLSEQIITYADLFFSKSDIYHKRSLAEVTKKIATYGKKQLKDFYSLHKKFTF